MEELSHGFRLHSLALRVAHGRCPVSGAALVSTAAPGWGMGHGEPCNSPTPWGPAAHMVPTVSLLRAEDAASHNLFNVFKEKK